MPARVHRAGRSRHRRFGGVLKRAVTSIEEDEIGAHVVGNVQVDPAVAVQVSGDDAQAPAVGAAHSRGDGHVGEGPVAVIAIKRVPRGCDRVRRAIDPDRARARAPMPIWPLQV